MVAMFLVAKRPSPSSCRCSPIFTALVSFIVALRIATAS